MRNYNTKGMRIFLIEQNVANLFGDYLSEAVVIAKDAKSAVAAVMSLRDEESGWGLTVKKNRLTTTDLAPAPDTFSLIPKFTHEDSLLISVGTGEDYDEPPSENDDEDEDDEDEED